MTAEVILMDMVDQKKYRQPGKERSKKGNTVFTVDQQINTAAPGSHGIPDTPKIYREKISPADNLHSVNIFIVNISPVISAENSNPVAGCHPLFGNFMNVGFGSSGPFVTDIPPVENKYSKLLGLIQNCRLFPDKV